jgi:hypothetical protein
MKSPTIHLGDIAHARSGDKGDRSNIGIVANNIKAYEHLREYLTTEVVAAFFAPMGIGKVVRHELPRIHALNFVMDHALAGGASRSLRLDTQGKALGTVMLECPIAAFSSSESLG